MTANQIAFYKAKQEAKHYRRQDKIQRQQLEESKRHNFATESLSSEELGIKDWANKANVELGFTNAAINQSHYERQDALNQAHYERSDANAEKLGRIQNDQLLLDYIQALGTPVSEYDLDAHGNRVSQGSEKYVSVSDYYASGNKPSFSFETTPISLNYLSPSALGQYGRSISGVASILSTIIKTFK